MPETELWKRLRKALGEEYANVWADQTVLAELGGRTVREALADKLTPKQIWSAVWRYLELPPIDR